jgi:hypothetical protein
MDRDGAAKERTEGRREFKSWIPAPVSVRAVILRCRGVGRPPLQVLSHLPRGVDRFLGFSLGRTGAIMAFGCSRSALAPR